MAVLIPALHSCLRRMTSGEKRLAERLQDKLEADYCCWYDVPIGPRHQYPDFLIVHPSRGLLVLEVKDWRIDTIQSVDKQSATIITDQGAKTVANPLEQARQYTLSVVNLLRNDPQLRVDDGKYQGHLICPYGYGVILSNITRRQFNEANLAEVIPPNHVICKDEMTESMDAEAFQQLLWGMFTVQFQHHLSMPQLNRIRWHLFPQVRIETSIFEEAKTTQEKSSQHILPNLIRVMDIQQEQLARSLGHGHRVIHGVAGSGKTLILGYRCEVLAKVMRKPILVLCYNIALAAKLRATMAEKDLTAKVHVHHFHEWCKAQCQTYQVDVDRSFAPSYDAAVDAVIRAVDREQIPRAQYSAVMIDEGHDFRSEWLKLVVQMIDPDTENLLLLYDDAQSIYERKRRAKFSLSSVGIQARGRTTILRLNYRNTDEILNFAYEFAKDILTPQDSDEDTIPLVKPEGAGRTGPKPLLIQLPNLHTEINYIIERFQHLHDEGSAWRNMAVCYRTKSVGEQISRSFQRAGIPCSLMQSSSAKRVFDPATDTVKIVTMHSSKGLEFPVVAIPGIGSMPVKEDNVDDEARLLYVAMTRAMDQLLVTYSQNSIFTDRLSAMD